MYSPNNPLAGQMNAMSALQPPMQIPHQQPQMMNALQGFRDARQDWRSQRPEMGGDMQGWRQDRPNLMSYLNPPQQNPAFPPNQMPSFMHMPTQHPMQRPGMSQQQQPPLLGQSMNVQGMVPATSAFGLPTY